MSLVYNVLLELGYQAAEAFFTPLELSEDIQVLPFVSAQSPSQVYLIITIKQDMLPTILSKTFLPNMSKRFRSQPYFIAEMTKNTSLLILNLCEDSSDCISSEKLHIEDDPLYFKKYVLSYTDLEYSKALEYMSFQKESEGGGFLYTTCIQKYLLNSVYFDKYKNSHLNEPIYTYLAELSTKLPILPLPIANTKELKNVNSFLKAEIKTIAEKKQNPINVELHKLDTMLTLVEDWKDASIDTIIKQWNSLDMTVAEDGEG